MKIHHLVLENYRGFTRFELYGLGRVNLLVGTNNCGKTTVLEAVSILMASGDFQPIWSTLIRRGEELYQAERDPTPAGAGRQVDLRRLFRGHRIEVDREFRISSEGEGGPRTLVARITDLPIAREEPYEAEPPLTETLEDLLPPLSLHLRWSNSAERELTIPISRRAGIPSQAIRRSMGTFDGMDNVPVQFVTATSFSAESVAAKFEEIVLTPKEELVTEAMRIIEPSIERIASSGSDRFHLGSRSALRGGILVRLRGVEDRLPIGSMGDGIWRMLGLALAAVTSSDGILLVDDIDTGFHHTIMEEMWKFLHHCSKRFNIQVIATTHSWDCYQSLAAICRDSAADENEVTINRIEQGRTTAVRYDEQEIVAVADRDIEVR
jgi:hypothetical protein